jgi:hypothetical protein
MEYTYKCMRAILQHPTINSTQEQTKLHRGRLQVVDSVPARVCVGGEGAGGGTCLCERGGSMHRHEEPYGCWGVGDLLLVPLLTWHHKVCMCCATQHQGGGG